MNLIASHLTVNIDCDVGGVMVPTCDGIIHHFIITLAGNLTETKKNKNKSNLFPIRLNQWNLLQSPISSIYPDFLRINATARVKLLKNGWKANQRAVKQIGVILAIFLH